MSKILKWTKESEEQLVLLKSQKIPDKEIAKIMNISPNSVYSRLALINKKKRNGQRIRTQPYKIYTQEYINDIQKYLKEHGHIATLNKYGSYAIKALQKRKLWTRQLKIIEKYFDRFIQSDLKYYWAGFIAADGYLPNNTTLRIGLAHKDHDHLLKIKELLGGEVYRNKQHSEFVIHGEPKLIEFLNSLNITNNKSLTLKPPNNLTEEQTRLFILGYFDGDGSISAIQNKNYKKLVISFLGTYEFLSWIKENIDKLELFSKVNVIKHKSIFAISYGVKRDVKRICEWLFKNTYFSLDRKRNKYLKNKHLFEYNGFEHKSIYFKQLKEQL
jgi:hypothetical protein